MTNSYRVRPYEPKDCNRLLEIWLEASRFGHPFFTEEQLAKQQKEVRDRYLPHAENWVAVNESDIAFGFIGLLGNFIGGLFVDPALHRSGIGRLLVEHAVSLKGPLSLEVYALNAPARAFYAHLGFLEGTSRPTDDNGLPLEVIRMVMQKS